MNEAGRHPVTQCGATGDGVTDDTAAFQRAIDEAAERGGVVYVPPANYRIEGCLSVKPGVSIIGVHDAPTAFGPPIASVIHVTGGRGQPDGSAAFEMGDSTMLRGITMFWPDQHPDDIQPYPWAIRLFGNDNTVENVTFINAYNGIRVGPEVNSHHRIRSVCGCFLHRGIFVDNTWEIGRIENCQFHPLWWSQETFGGDYEKACQYMFDHLEAFTFGRTDWEYVTNNFVFACKVGYRFVHTENGEFNGHLTGCGADGSGTAILVERLQKMGMLVTGGEFVSLSGADPVQLRVADCCDQGNIRFVNTAFWGLSNHVAVLQGDTYVSFGDCYFTTWKEGIADNPLIVAEKGRLQVHDSTFDAPHPSVRLGPGLKHAIVRANNGIAGVRIQDETGGKAVLADNEPPSETTKLPNYMPEKPA